MACSNNKWKQQESNPFILYEEDLHSLLINTGTCPVMKTDTDKVKVTECANKNYIVCDGSGILNAPGTLNSISSFNGWELKIPVSNIQKVHHKSFIAQGCLYNHSDVVGIDALVDGVAWNYGIWTSNSQALYNAVNRVFHESNDQNYR